MITFEFVNDRSGPDTAANYRVSVAVNHRQVATGRVEGHPRAEHWSSLLRRFLATLEAPQAVPAVVTAGELAELTPDHAREKRLVSESGADLQAVKTEIERLKAGWLELFDRGVVADVGLDEV